MPRGVNPYDEARIQERNAADANIVNIVSPGLITDGAVVQLDAGNLASYPGTGTNWLTQAGTTNYTVNATWNPAGYFTFNGTSHDAYSTNSVSYPGPPVLNDINFGATGWFRTSSASGRKIFGSENVNSGTGGSSYDKHLYINTSGNLVWGVYPGSAQTITSAGTYADSVWHHFGVVYNRTAGSCTLYVDGASVGTMAQISTDSNSFIRIGSYRLTGWPGSAGDGFFPGDIANFAFYTNIILTPIQISQHYNATRARFGV